MDKRGRFGSTWGKFQEIFLVPLEALIECGISIEKIELRLSAHVL